MGKDVAALVNGRPIKMEVLIKTAGLSSGLEEASGQEREVIKEILNQLVDEELVLEEAEKRELSVTQRELADRIAEIRRDYPGRSFEEMLIKEYISFDEWKASLKRNLLIRKTIEIELGSRLVLDSKELGSLSELYKTELIHPSLYKVKHVSFLDKDEAQAVLKTIRNGRDFDLAAATQKIKNLPTSGWIDLRYLPPEIGQAIEQTKTGDVSEVVESYYGYSIFKVIEIKPGRPMTPKEAEAFLQRRALTLQEEELYVQWIQELKQKAAIKINPALAAYYDRNQ